MSFHAEVLQPGDTVYVSNSRGDRVRIWYADDNGAMSEIGVPMLPDPPYDPNATVIMHTQPIKPHKGRP